MTVHVAWNLSWLRPGVVGGSEEYATRQLQALVDHAAAEVTVTAFVLQPFAAAYPELAARVDCRPLPLDGRNKPVRVLAESTLLASRTRRGFDLVHHVGGRMPRVAPGPRVLTVHDLQPLAQPENFSTVKRHFLARALPRSIARATAIITPSEHVRDHVLEEFAVDPDRVVAIAAPVVSRAHVPRIDVDTLHPELRALVVDRVPFFIYPAITYTHKNHAVLLEAFALLRRAHPEARLVLCGGPGGAESAVVERISRRDLEGSVVRPGRVDRDVLDVLLDRAAALVFPSRYEGFGLPVVEALSAQCPVISSNATSLGEVVGEAGVLVDPTDAEAWAHAMTDALEKPGYRGRHAAEGLQVAARYTPERTAAALVSVYRRVLSGW